MASHAGLWERLGALGLLKDPAQQSPSPEQRLPALCHAGALKGGLSVALDLQPDELIGPLAAELGGEARQLKVLDVRDRPELELEVALRGRTERWAVPDAEALVERVNAAFAGVTGVRAVAFLGEWEEMRQLWCVDRSSLAALLREPWFRPLNARQLRAAPRTRQQ